MQHQEHKMKITDIEIIPIYPRLAERYENRKVDLYGIDPSDGFQGPYR